MARLSQQNYFNRSGVLQLLLLSENITNAIDLVIHSTYIMIQFGLDMNLQSQRHEIWAYTSH